MARHKTVLINMSTQNGLTLKILCTNLNDGTTADLITLLPPIFYFLLKYSHDLNRAQVGFNDCAFLGLSFLVFKWSICGLVFKFTNKLQLFWYSDRPSLCYGCCCVLSAVGGPLGGGRT